MLPNTAADIATITITEDGILVMAHSRASRRPTEKIAHLRGQETAALQDNHFKRSSGRDADLFFCLA
jgi:hypothetical protein